MEFDLMNDRVTFSSGTTAYCYGDSFSISADGCETPELSFGSDGAITADFNGLTPADCVEAADHMIERWQRFRAHWAAKQEA